MEEEEEEEAPHYPLQVTTAAMDSMLFGVAQTSVDVEQGVIRVERETADSHYR